MKTLTLLLLLALVGGCAATGPAPGCVLSETRTTRGIPYSAASAPAFSNHQGTCK